MTVNEAIERARSLEYYGDPRLGMIGFQTAARVLADEVERLRARIERLQKAGSLPIVGKVMEDGTVIWTDDDEELLQEILEDISDESDDTSTRRREDRRPKPIPRC